MLLIIIINKFQWSCIHLFPKSFRQLLNISLDSFTFLKTFDSEFSYIEVSFTDQNSNLLEIDKINTTIVIN